MREDIWAARLQPGSRLVESDLTARFAVSRGPVREGLRRLSADGLIEHRPHRGAVVRRLTEREIRELFLIRIEMEALAARLAAVAEAPERRARFAASIKPIHSDAARNPCDYLKENAAFHDAVMALADNLELRDLAIRLQLPLIMAQVGDVLTPPVLEASVREHRAIAEAILARTQRPRRRGCASISNGPRRWRLPRALLGQRRKAGATSRRRRSARSARAVRVNPRLPSPRAVARLARVDAPLYAAARPDSAASSPARRLGLGASARQA